MVKKQQQKVKEKGTKQANADSVKKLEQDSQEVLEDVKKILTTKKARKVEHYVVIALYVVVIGVLGYLLVANFLPGVFGKTSYELSASETALTNNVRTLYLSDEKVFGGVAKVEDRSLRLVISQKPFYFVFNPKKVVPINSSAEIQLEFYQPESDIYLNDQLIVPSLQYYQLVADFPENHTQVWARLNVLQEDKELENASSAEDFIQKNFVENSVYSFAGISSAPVIKDYSKKNTLINQTFRDNLKLVVYAEDSLEIEFTKQDLNWYIGRDEYNVEITNFQGEPVFNQTFQDDGDGKDSKILGKKQDFKIKLENISKNIYYVAFIKDSNNQAADLTLKNIKLNTNKVMIAGTFLPTEPFKFYIQVTSPKIIGFNFWWNDKSQKINITGTVNKVVDLSKDWQSRRYEESLNLRGNYYLDMEKGYAWVYSDFITLDRDNWFDFPDINTKRYLDSDLIILDTNKLKINGEKISYKGQVVIGEGQTKIKLQALDDLRVFFESVKLVV